MRQYLEEKSIGHNIDAGYYQEKASHREGAETDESLNGWKEKIGNVIKPLLAPIR